MKKTRAQKGITLVALIITIIVLLILAVVSIGFAINSGLIGSTQNSVNSYITKEAKEKIELIVSEWLIEKHISNNTLEDYLNNKKTDGTINNFTKNEDGTYTVEIIHGNIAFSTMLDEEGKTIGEIQKVSPQYSNIRVVVNSDGTGESLEKGSVDKTTTPELYINFDHSMQGVQTKVEPSLPYKVTQNGVYTFKIIGNIYGEEVTTEVEVTVNQFKLPFKLGTYIEYDVPYTDMCITDENTESGMKEFTSTTGWKYFGQNKEGHDMLITQGFPLMLNYNYDGTNANWWGTVEESAKEFNVSEEEAKNGPAIRAATGLRNKFTQIEFVAGTTVSKKNTGAYRKIGEKTEGKLFQNGANEFIAEGFEGATVGITIAENDYNNNYRMV